MFKEALTHLHGNDLVPIIFLCVFIVFFVLMISWVMKIDKKTIKEYAKMPLDNPDALSTKGE
ncbi:MAG: hypothetical protein H6696_10325 [Deferribacteres bacterium]|nr:hypothetical protein [candidate division KSB1 bacterium]MCB9502325.1 hypothetical protein [Deferribacteres bacterium]